MRYAIFDVISLSQDFDHEVRIRTNFARFQEYFELIIEPKNDPTARITTGKMYVGKYFTEKGEYDEVRLS